MKDQLILIYIHKNFLIIIQKAVIHNVKNVD